MTPPSFAAFLVVTVLLAAVMLASVAVYDGAAFLARLRHRRRPPVRHARRGPSQRHPAARALHAAPPGSFTYRCRCGRPVRAVPGDWPEWPAVCACGQVRWFTRRERATI